MENYVRLFNKIQLLNSMANQIGYYALNQGNATVMDKIDMNCGAIPEGEFDQIIDLSAPQQFLSLYQQISENRFAMAVTELLKMSPQFMKALLDYCEQVGKDLKIGTVENAVSAFEVYQSIILDGMNESETKKVMVQKEDCVIWEKTLDTHEQAWKNAGGDICVYYQLQQSLVTGLLSQSSFIFKITDNTTFEIIRK